ncbi:MAG: adenosylmethionine decarboxylase [Chloroflexi bacterium]|nr:adenosylmethionine decarboxylase [Chloroflexota bacterium]
MNALGTHLLLELKDCDRYILNDLSALRNILLSAAREVGATVVGETFHRFNPHGVTGVLAIAESHLCIHTWPEYGYAAVDIFTCGDSFNPEKATEIFVSELHAKEHSIITLKRGIIPIASKV